MDIKPTNTHGMDSLKSSQPSIKAAERSAPSKFQEEQIRDLLEIQERANLIESQRDWEGLEKFSNSLMVAARSGSMEEAYLMYLLGKAYIESNKWDQAALALKRSVHLHPVFCYSHHLLGRCHARAGRWADAVKAQQQACALAADFSYSWYEQGIAHSALLNHAAAIHCHRQAEKLDTRQLLFRQARVNAEIHEALADREVAKAADIITTFLCEETPGENIIIEWIQLCGTLALAGEIAEALLLAKALTVDGNGAIASAQPLPRRSARFLQALLMLMLGDYVDGEGLITLGQGLRELTWMPVHALEIRLWNEILNPLTLNLNSRIAAGQVGRSLMPEALMNALIHTVDGVFGDVLLALSLATQFEEQCRSGGRRNAGGAFTAKLQKLAYRSGAYEQVLAICSQNHSEAATASYAPSVATNFMCSIAQMRLSSQDLGFFVNEFDRLVTQCRSMARCDRRDSRAYRELDQQLWTFNTLALDRSNRLAQQAGALPQALELRDRSISCLGEAVVAFTHLDGMEPMPAIPRLRQRWLLVASNDLPQCYLYRVDQKREQLEAMGCSVQILSSDRMKYWSATDLLLWAEAIVFCRIPATYPALRFMERARRFGLPVYYDIDDLIFDPVHFPPPLATYGGTVGPEIHRGLAMDVALFRQAMEQADCLIMSTRTLALRWLELSRRTGQKVVVLPNLAPPDLLRMARPPKPAQKQRMRLVFASGTLAHKQAWKEELAPAIAELLRSNSMLELHLPGYVEVPEEIALYGKRVCCYPYIPYRQYLEVLGKCDIGLAVLEPGIVTDAKSAIKWMEYSLMGLASIVSPTATYKEILSDDHHVLFATGVDGWIQQIQRLIDRPEKRLSLAYSAYKLAHGLFGPNTSRRFWNQLLEPPSTPLPPPRKRVLVINVYFAPQSVGGATRVAQDQVRGLMEKAPDTYEITVLCVDHDPWQGTSDDIRIPVDVHHWHGAKVVRLGLPGKPWSWHHDGAVEHFCRWWFKQESFDLIHAHCLQILTAAPLKVASELGIPYVVSLHDGWWLSPLQFLVTDNGHTVDPADPLGHLTNENSPDPETRAALLERRRDLEEILAGASERLAVSASFAALYRKAGIIDVGVLENDWTPMPAPDRRERQSGDPLHICHVGGMAIHKGYPVLRAAVLHQPLSEALITVIDHSLPEGECYGSNWNGTPVSFIAPVPMAEMPSFYASQDVLVAPSTWPESYGLVTREALSAGLWVVASDIGALAEPIKEGVNGNRVSPGDSDALGIALERLCQGAFHAPMPSTGEDKTPNEEGALAILLNMYANLA